MKIRAGTKSHEIWEANLERSLHLPPQGDDLMMLTVASCSALAAWQSCSVQAVAGTQRCSTWMATSSATGAMAGVVQPTAGESSAPASSVPAERLLGTDRPTMWSEFAQLAAETGAVNLGQGFPDWQPPEFVVAEAQRALEEGYHQYTRPAGHPRLVSVLADRYSQHMQRSIDAMTEICVTVGASQALYLTLQALVNPGDEVVVLEPAFDLYYGQIRLAGGTTVPVTLDVDEDGHRWTLDVSRLEAAITPRTKVLILNSPHNPTGRTYGADEMAAVADVLRRHPGVLVISDEVYKYTVYAEEPHVHFAALPGMYERTVTLSSAGKTFSITGWQAGWCVGPPALIKPIQLLLPFVQFCATTPMQQALSHILQLADDPFEDQPSYYAWLVDMYRKKREILAEGLERSGIVPMQANAPSRECRLCRRSLRTHPCVPLPAYRSQRTHPCTCPPSRVNLPPHP